MKTHFANIEQRANESNPQDEWGPTACGRESENLDNDWTMIDCKDCLNRREQHEKEMRLAMEHSVRDMAGFVAFMEKNK
jgi:hypothetical protein